MFLTFLLRLLKGYVRIEVKGPFPSRFINLANMKGLGIWDIKRMGENLFCLSISVADFKRLKNILRKTNTRVHILKKTGLPFLLHRYRKRAGLYIGALLFTVIVFLMSAFVWQVDVSGNSRISEAQILNALNQSGFYEGVLKSRVNLRSVRQNVRALIPEISFIELNIKGAKAYVVVTEREEAPEVVDENSPCNLIASRSAKIERTEVTAGQPLVKAGDTVKEGQLLVSGIIDSNEVGYFLVHSTGRIYASSEYTLSVECPYETTVYKRTGSFIQKKRLRLFNFYINLYFGGGIEYAFYDKIIRIEEAKIGEYVLPVELETTTYYEKLEHKSVSSKEACEARARVMLSQTARTEFAGKEVTFEQVTVEHKNNGCSATGRYIVIEDIAKPLLIETERNLGIGTDS